MAKKPTTQSSPKHEPDSRRIQVAQKDLPAYELKQALRVPRALVENFGSHATKPLKIAQAMGLQPNTGSFRQLCGAAVAYGLIQGGAYSDEITLAPLGSRILKPKSEGDDLRAKKEAFLSPRIIGAFLKRYDGSPLPKDDIAINVLEDLGVPSGRGAAAYELIVDGAEELGLVTTINGRKYVNLEVSETSRSIEAIEDPSREMSTEEPSQVQPPAREVVSAKAPPADMRMRRVFITHGKNKAFIEPLTEV